MKLIKHTKKINDRVFISNGSLYGKYSTKDRAEYVANLAIRTVGVLESYLLIPDSVRYVITKIAERNTEGMYTPSLDQIVIDCRTDDRTVIESLCHESVHVDQVARGDLSWINEHDVIWQGNLFPAVNKYTYRQYKQTPWEREAHERQQQLADTVIATAFS
jgi:hypothetical protein